MKELKVKIKFRNTGRTVNLTVTPNQKLGEIVDLAYNEANEEKRSGDRISCGGQSLDDSLHMSIQAIKASKCDGLIEIARPTGGA